MKKILYILTAAALMIGCKDKDLDIDKPNQEEPGTENPTPQPPAPEETLADKLIGEWHSTDLAVEADIYIGFSEDNTFEMYQQITEGAYRLYRGTWELQDDVLSGKYNDGEAWAADYTIEIEGDSLKMTSKNEAAEVSQYTKAAIPDSVKETCVPVVKSAEAGL